MQKSAKILENQAEKSIKMGGWKIVLFFVLRRFKAEYVYPKITLFLLHIPKFKIVSIWDELSR